MPINWHGPSEQFFLDLPHPEADRLIALGWQETEGKTRLYTKDPDIAFIDSDLFGDELNALLNAFTRIPRKITDEEWDRYTAPGVTLFDNQKATIEFALGTGGGRGTVVGDPPGAGKTATNITLANIIQPRAWLIVCPASVKINWSVEIERFSTIKYDVVEVIERATRVEHKKRLRAAYRDGKSVVMIINYDILKDFAQIIKKDIVWDIITFDESHKLKSPKAKRTQFCVGGGNAKGLTAPHVLFTSATKLNRPIDLWPILKYSDPSRLGKDKYAFVERYCGGEYNDFTGGLSDQGSSNIDELGFLMGQSFFIRHDIDHLLPPFREETIFFAPSEMVRKVEDKLFDALFDQEMAFDNPAFAMFRSRFLAAQAEARGLQAEELDEQRVRVFTKTFIEHGDLISRIPALFTMLSELRKVTGMAKVPHIIEHIKEQFERGNDEPIVLMMHHKDVVKAVAAAFEGQYVKVVGGMTSVQRQEAIVSFQAGGAPLFLGNIAAAGEGITLTKSCHLIFGEIDWNATAMWQALKRVHRLTQSKEVTIQYLLLRGSLDGNLAQRYIEKRETINEFFGGAEMARCQRKKD